MSDLTTKEMVDQIDVIMRLQPTRTGIPRDARVVYLDVLREWGERLKLIERIDLARLRELADAEKDGRLVVLPVAEGGTAATPDGDAILNSWDIVARVTFCNEKRSHVYWKDKYADFDISDIKSKE